MHNTFIVEFFHWKRPQSLKLKAANFVLRQLGREVRLTNPAPMIMGSVESRMNIFHFAHQVLAYGIPGDFVEVGCNAGYSSTILQKVLVEQGSDRQLHVFDSFRGLPDAVDARDEGAYEPAEMSVTRAGFEQNFKTVGLPLPHIHEGWFEDTLSKGLPDKVAFALIDADLYGSTCTALEHVYPRLSRGAVCMFGVYWDPTVYQPPTGSIKYRSPGVKKACDEFFRDKPEAVSVLYSGDYSSGYFRKR